MESVAVKDQSAFAARVVANRLASIGYSSHNCTCKVLNKVSCTCTCTCNFRLAHTVHPVHVHCT